MNIPKLCSIASLITLIALNLAMPVNAKSSNPLRLFLGPIFLAKPKKMKFKAPKRIRVTSPAAPIIKTPTSEPIQLLPLSLAESATPAPMKEISIVAMMETTPVVETFRERLDLASVDKEFDDIITETIFDFDDIQFDNIQEVTVDCPATTINIKEEIPALSNGTTVRFADWIYEHRIAIGATVATTALIISGLYIYHKYYKTGKKDQ